MKNFIIYSSVTGNITRTGNCVDGDFKYQAKENESIIEGIASSSTQKIDVNTKEVINKTQAEIEVEKLPEIPLENRRANITNEQWQDILDRLNALET